MKQLTARIAVAAGAALLASAAPAAADSITYVKDNNIWVAGPDGSANHQVTSDGTAAVAYRSPSMDDSGVIVAGHGNEIVRLRQNGQVLSHFDPPSATDSTGETVDGVPQGVAVSPNGQRIAFTYAEYDCPPGASCGARQVLLYSYADRATPVATFGEQFNLRNPSWIDDSQVLEFGGHFRQVNIDTPGGGDDDATHWFEDPGNEDLGDGELARAGDRLAAIRSYGDGTHIGIYSVQGGPGGSVDLACFTGKDATLSSPTWSPDGRSLAFADSAGIEVMPMPNVVPGDCPGAASSAVVIPGGQEPDWSPAPVAADAPAAPAASLQVSAPRSIRVRTALRKGVVIHVTGSAAGQVAARGAFGRVTAGARSAQLRQPGRIAVRLRIGRSGARYLRRHPRAKLSVRVTLTPSGATPLRRSATVRIQP